MPSSFSTRFAKARIIGPLPLRCAIIRPRELIFGGRLATRLAGSRLSRRLFRAARDRDPDNPRVRYLSLAPEGGPAEFGLDPETQLEYGQSQAEPSRLLLLFFRASGGFCTRTT